MYLMSWHCYSYEYLESAVTTWCDQGIMDEIQARKLVFVETQDGAETSIALDNFQKVRLWLRCCCAAVPRTVALPCMQVTTVC